jgi:hypothetical protein
VSFNSFLDIVGISSIEALITTAEYIDKVRHYFFSFMPKIPLITPSRRAKISAGRNPSTRNPSTRFPVSITINPVIKKETSPSVIQLSGAVRIRATPQIIRFTRANTIPTTIAVQNPSTVTPGVIQAARAMTSPQRINSRIKAIVKKLATKQCHYSFF